MFSFLALSLTLSLVLLFGLTDCYVLASGSSDCRTAGDSTSCITSIPYEGPTGYANSVYFTSWSPHDQHFFPQNLPTDTLTHIYYAFANLTTTGEVFSFDPYADVQRRFPTDPSNSTSPRNSTTSTNAYGNIKQLYLHKKSNRSLKTLLSIGGWTVSAAFPAAARTPTTRSRFVTTAISLMKDWGMDGIDIDYEFPGGAPNSTAMAAFVLLLAQLRCDLDLYAAQFAPGYHFLLTVASPAGPQNYKPWHFADMNRYVDQFNLMGYDYSGAWSNYSGHASNLWNNTADNRSTPFNTDDAVQHYIARGVPAQKFVLGMPLYGRAFEKTNFIGSAYHGVGNGTYEAGVYEYKDLPKPGATVYTDEFAGATFSFDQRSRELVSYDTPQMVEWKMEYVKEVGLGGAMFWEASGDKGGEESLVRTSWEALGGCGWMDERRNLLSYPDSLYANMRAGMPGE